jgi:DNA polymerase-3 subunit gamma/tau
VCASCKEIAAGGSVDVIEIDAASNRGINEMRELRENVRYQPARDRYKVFIIDEAHQITNEAFNALLKTIEEPPAWAVFMLCTTEAHKIPATIASRCQHFSFRSVEFEALVARMAWICEQEGIHADAEALSVLAQAGEGSVRDSLSALDQAIACCGDTLQASEVRALLGAFSLDALGHVSQALVDGAAARMLEVVNELERNGQNLQHFSRELARYFRNLLVAKIAGGETRLIAASAGERQRLAEMAAQFSEEDLTRYLQLSLDLFRDLQTSLQPRFHLELGLLRMVQAGRLVSIEDALAGLGAQAKPAPRPQPPAPSPRSSGTSPQPPAPSPSAWRDKLHAALMDLGMAFTADAIEHSEIVEANGELRFTTPREFSVAMKEADINQAVRQILGKPLKIKVTIGDVAVQNKVAAAPAQEDDVSRRALANPEVQNFRELFGGEIRTVRNLKE